MCQTYVSDWHDKFQVDFEVEPHLPIGTPEYFLRQKLITEEYWEVIDAFEKGDIKHLAKELADLVWVCFGAADVFGFDLDEVLLEVYRSNLSKLGSDGEPIRREDGKILKGPNYFEPDLSFLG